MLIFDTVQVMVAVWACRTTFLICITRDLDIYTLMTDFRASGTTAVAMQRRRQGEADGKSQTEGYRECFHRGTISLQLKLVPY